MRIPPILASQTSDSQDVQPSNFSRAISSRSTIF
jgi:hypothetical protein